eukprot:1162131-Pelagomonas_calceolata.AAC.1
MRAELGQHALRVQLVIEPLAKKKQHAGPRGTKSIALTQGYIESTSASIDKPLPHTRKHKQQSENVNQES